MAETDGATKEKELSNSIEELLKSLAAEEIENDPVLMREIAQLLNFKFGLSRKDFERLFMTFAENRKHYQSLYKAIEEEVINKSSLSSFKI